MTSKNAQKLLSSYDIKNNAVLKEVQEYEMAIEILKSMQLPRHPDSPKNWDSLAALSIILKYTDTNSNILDAGGEMYSVLLPQLRILGYKNLTCINLAYSGECFQNNIRYETGDITHTRFDDNYFHAISCLSVIEHGVNFDDYFKEMERILAPSGILFISTDYWHESVDTNNQKAFGVPIQIFTSDGIEKIIRVAEKYGLKLVIPIDFQCINKLVEWKPYYLKYTFMYFLLQKIDH